MTLCKCGIAQADCEYHKPEPKYAGVYGVDPCDGPEDRMHKLSELLCAGAISREQFTAWLDNPPDESVAFLREPAADVYTYTIVSEHIDQHGRVVRYGTYNTGKPGHYVCVRL